MGQREKTFNLFARTGAKTAKRLFWLLPVATVFIIAAIYLIIGLTKGDWNWTAFAGVVASTLVGIGLLRD